MYCIFVWISYWCQWYLAITDHIGRLSERATEVCTREKRKEDRWAFLKLLRSHWFWKSILLARETILLSILDVAVPPWVGYNEEETIQQQILALSAVSVRPSSLVCIIFNYLHRSHKLCVKWLQDKRNFLRDPPAGVQFHFDFDQMFPVALVMLQEDELLNRMRFDLVPKQWVHIWSRTICHNIIKIS